MSYKTKRTSMVSLTTFGFSLLISICLSPRLGSKTGDLNGVKNSRWPMELTHRHRHYFSSPIPLPWHTDDLSWGLSTSSLVGREAHVSFVWAVHHASSITTLYTSKWKWCQIIYYLKSSLSLLLTFFRFYNLCLLFSPALELSNIILPSANLILQGSRLTQ